MHYLQNRMFRYIRKCSSKLIIIDKSNQQVQDIILRPLAVDMPSLVKQLTTEKK